MGGMKSSGTLMTADDSPQLYDSSVCVASAGHLLCVCVCVSVYLCVRRFINALFFPKEAVFLSNLNTAGSPQT